jgi:TolB-like protein
MRWYEQPLAWMGLCTYRCSACRRRFFASRSHDVDEASDEKKSRSHSPMRGHASVVVLPFRNQTGDERLSFFSDILMDGVSRQSEERHPQSARLQTATLSLIRSGVLGEICLDDPGDAVQIGRRVGADVVCTGRYFEADGQLHVAASTFDISTGQLLSSAEYSFDAILELRRPSARGLLEAMEQNRHRAAASGVANELASAAVRT